MSENAPSGVSDLGAGDGTNQCVIWGSVCVLRDPTVWHRVCDGPGDKVRLEDRGSPDFVCQNQIVEGNAGRVRDKQKVDDRSSMCQEKRKMEGFM
jgi:hypothetical protein